MKWYFASNNQSPGYEYLIKAAVESAIKNTSLNPYFIYDGTPDALTDWLKKKGVNVIYHRASFYDSLKTFYPPDELRMAGGTFMRCDIPLLEAEDDLILYTDCDVLFVNEIHLHDLPQPSFSACAPEGIKTDWSFFNAGVMLMNIPALRETHHDFKTFIEKNLPTLKIYDQTAYNRFYAGRLTRLPLEYNWKPYWGENPDAKIIHFHGPKPHDLLQWLNGGPVRDIYEPLLAMERFGSIYYLSRFCRYSNALPIGQDEALARGAEFLERALTERTADLKAVQKKLLWKRLRKHSARLIEKINSVSRRSGGRPQ
jgi:hypothetical protein